MFDANIQIKHVKELIEETKNYDLINLDIGPRDICVLTNGNMLLVNYDKNCLVLLDRNLKFIKTIKKLNNKSFQPTYVDAYDDRIYVSDCLTSQIIITDLEFKHIKSFGTVGNESSNLNYPLGLQYYKDCLYVCDYYNKRIQKLDKNYEFINSYKLDFKPWQIKITNDLACVRSDGIPNGPQISFYKIANFEVVCRHVEHNGTISVLNALFYEYFNTTKTFFCYNKHGELVERIQLSDNLNILHDCWDGCLVYNDENLYLSCYEAKKLVRLSLTNKIVKL